MVYSRKVGGKVLTFGISGLLYKSNVLLYDHQTESLWSQLLNKSISGEYVGTPLTRIPAVTTTWKLWRKKHPQTRVLSSKTGYFRDYDRDPYVSFHLSPNLMFSVGGLRQDLPAKDMVLGLEKDGAARAWPLELLTRKKGEILTDRFGEMEVRIEVNPDGEIASVTDTDGRPLNAVYSYWYSWQAFYPGTSVYKE